MRVYISVDMEGIAGISHHRPTGRGDAGYPAACELMTGEANAAIEGALAAGAAEILVNDSHGGMYNLRPTLLNPAARLLQGQKAWSMVAGALPGPGGAPSFDVALFVGYHARAGHPTGHDRAHVLRRAGRDTPEWPPDRRIRRERPHPGRVGRSRSASSPATTRWPKRSKLAAVGRADRRQGGARHVRCRFAPSIASPRPDPGRCHAGRPPGRCRGRAGLLEVDRPA